MKREGRRIGWARGRAGYLIAAFFASVPARPLLAAGRVDPTPLAITTAGVELGESFDSLAASGAKSNVPVGWGFSEDAGENANAFYTGTNAPSATSGTFSYVSPTGSADRAFGSSTSFTGVSRTNIGAAFTNQTGATLSAFDISFVGEQWRYGTRTNKTQDRLIFNYKVVPAGGSPSLSLAATSDATQSGWTYDNRLDFKSIYYSGSSSVNFDPTTTPGATQAIAATLVRDLAPGETLVIRWTDISFGQDSSGIDILDDHLAIDDFKIKPSKTPEPTAALLATAGAAALLLRRSRRANAPS